MASFVYHFALVFLLLAMECTLTYQILKKKKKRQQDAIASVTHQDVINY